MKILLTPRHSLSVRLTGAAGQVFVGAQPAALQLVSIVRVGPRGPQGDVGPTGAQGPSGGAIDYPSIADAVALSGHRVVRGTPGGVAVCDASNASHRGAALGITTGAASSGAAVTVRAEGPMVEGSWSWTPGVPVFCGISGVLTQTFDPAWAWSQIVGIATSPTSIFVRLREPLSLA